MKRDASPHAAPPRLPREEPIVIARAGPMGSAYVPDALIEEIREVAATGLLPDGDAVNVSTLLWFEEWVGKLAPLPSRPASPGSGPALNGASFSDNP